MSEPDDPDVIPDSGVVGICFKKCWNRNSKAAVVIARERLAIRKMG